MDVQTEVAGNAGIAALIQALAAREIERPSTPGLCREAIEESYYQAERHGLEARLMVDDDDARRRHARSPAACSTKPAPTPPTSAAPRRWRGSSGSSADGNGAEAQRRAFEAGGMEGLLAALVARTT